MTITDRKFRNPPAPNFIRSFKKFYNTMKTRSESCQKRFWGTTTAINKPLSRSGFNHRTIISPDGTDTIYTTGLWIHHLCMQRDGSSREGWAWINSAVWLYSCDLALDCKHFSVYSVGPIFDPLQHSWLNPKTLLLGNFSLWVADCDDTVLGFSQMGQRSGVPLGGLKQIIYNGDDFCFL